MSHITTQYLRDIDSGDIQLDAQQLALLESLGELQLALIEQEKGVKKQVRSLRLTLGCRVDPIKGFYIYGDVGRGKTYVMDLFYQSLELDSKRRMHFHRFIQWMHESLKKHQGHKNPIDHIAGLFCEQVSVICFDELYVTDIADAMLLGGMFQALFKRGVTLICTSNASPDQLYEFGLQRSRFLPAIEALKKNQQVVTLDGASDYRMQHWQSFTQFMFPIDEGSKRHFEDYFHRLAHHHSHANQSVQICNRSLLAVRATETMIWFSFEVLCESNRSAIDYIEIAHHYSCVFLSGVRQMRAEDDSAARRFIALIDEFYDRQVKVVILSEVSIDQLYIGQQHVAIFERCSSRLFEMQTANYLAQPHLP